jgi:hypothetical protein
VSDVYVTGLETFFALRHRSYMTSPLPKSVHARLLPSLQSFTAIVCRYCLPSTPSTLDQTACVETPC